jgi:uncharacterized protein (TIGR03067 family)
VDTLSKILADDWVCNPTGARWTKSISLDHYRRSRYTEVKFLTERAVVRVDEHTAIMTYEVKWRAETKGSGPSAGHDRLVHCWVQRDGGWFVKYTECVPLAGAAEGEAAPQNARPRIRASGTWEKEIPENAFDGRLDTDWNSGTYAPAWIEADLGAAVPIECVVLIPCQDIAGATTHEVWISDRPIGDDRTKAKLIHTFKGETTNQQKLKFDFPKRPEELTARYVQIRTTQSPTWIAWWEVQIGVRGRERTERDGKKEAKTSDGSRDDRAALQGTWKVVSVEIGGKEAASPRQGTEWVVKGDWISPRSPDNRFPDSEVFAVRPDRNPKEIDINPDPVGAYLESDVIKGIYTLDGDEWKVCLPDTSLGFPGKEGAARPKEIATKESAATMLITLKRVK